MRCAVRAERLESYDVAYNDNLSWYGDLVNPRPEWLH